MAKILLWTSIGVFSALGGYLPMLLMTGDATIASVLGSLAGGLFGIFMYVKLRDAGYIE
ncbi:hypothetical protein KDA06_02790 [Candidatus Saccharibacteria bacterium]|jgi:uncharacterized membrane protein YjjB (DUF3815 family)|nr:hypothetical protein [Candidatus Saccharibacteria bacterium]HPR09601.1 hypothetical protein [Candidatus Saccharibacteria bacterium]